MQFTALQGTYQIWSLLCVALDVSSKLVGSGKPPGAAVERALCVCVCVHVCVCMCVCVCMRMLCACVLVTMQFTVSQ